MSDGKLLKERILDEIQKDPDNKGYSGKTPKEIAELMNQETVIREDIVQPEAVEEVVLPTPGTKIGEKVITKDAPVLKIIVGIPGIPNTITEEEIIEALK